MVMFFYTAECSTVLKKSSTCVRIISVRHLFPFSFTYKVKPTHISLITNAQTSLHGDIKLPGSVVQTIQGLSQLPYLVWAPCFLWWLYIHIPFRRTPRRNANMISVDLMFQALGTDAAIQIVATDLPIVGESVRVSSSSWKPLAFRCASMSSPLYVSTQCVDIHGCPTYSTSSYTSNSSNFLNSSCLTFNNV